MSSLTLHRMVAGRSGFRLPALDQTLAAGQVIALIGPNGAGKTTLLKTLAGLLPPLEGTVSGGGLAAWLPPPGEVGAGFSALHLVSLGRIGKRRWAVGLAPDDLKAAEAALDRLGIGDLSGRPFDQLSSGQRQLVLIARLFVQDAPVCLLDEPLAMLDLAHAQAVETAIRDLADEGRTVIVSTHHLPLAARADQVLALGPDWVETGPPDRMLTPSCLTALFGIAHAVCPCCGQALSRSNLPSSLHA